MSEASSESWIRSLSPFVVMYFGGFVTCSTFDCFVFPAAHWRWALGGTGRGQLAPDGLPDYRVIVIPLSGWLTRVFCTRWLFTASAAASRLPACCAGSRGISTHDPLSRVQGAWGASMIPIVFTSSLHYLPGASSRLFRCRRRHHCVGRADAWSNHWRLDYRHLELALAFLRQPRTRPGDYVFDPASGRHRQAGSAPPQRR